MMYKYTQKSIWIWKVFKKAFTIGVLESSLQNYFLRVGQEKRIII